MGLFKNDNFVQKDFCERNRETGAQVCKTVRIFRDGSEQEIAGVTFNSDGNCNISAEDGFEVEEGALLKLEKKFGPKMRARCKNTPPEY